MIRKYIVETKCNRHEASSVRTVNPHDLKYEFFNNAEFLEVFRFKPTMKLGTPLHRELHECMTNDPRNSWCGAKYSRLMIIFLFKVFMHGK